MAASVKVDGLRDLERALEQLPKATGKNVLRRTLKKAAEPVADAMRAMAPNDPNTSGNDLESSIGVSTKLSPRQRKAHRKMFKSDRASVEMFVGAGPVPQAHQQEFGNINHGPQAFGRPAWDANKMRVLASIKDDMGDEILKAAQRLAKKQAKAKG